MFKFSGHHLVCPDSESCTSSTVDTDPFKFPADAGGPARGAGASLSGTELAGEPECTTSEGFTRCASRLRPARRRLAVAADFKLTRTTVPTMPAAPNGSPIARATTALGDSAAEELDLEPDCTIISESVAGEPKGLGEGAAHSVALHSNCVHLGDIRADTCMMMINTS